MEKYNIQLAKDIMELKIKKTIEENKQTDYLIFKKQLDNLLKEKDELYNKNESILHKVFDVYLKEVNM